MKKTTMMRIASTLLIAVLLTTCAIGATMAKYVTTDSATDNAQVAKWGIKIAVGPKTGTEGDAFAATYDDVANGTAVVAKSGATYELVAPGTSGTLLTTTITGAPEVLLDVKADVNVDLANWIVGENVYFPIVVKINGTPVTVSGTLEEIEATLEDAIIDAILGTTGTATVAESASTRTSRYDANTTFTTDVTVTWEWDFDANGAGTNDVNDTALGDAAADATPATISITSTVTATQVDKPATRE